MQSSFYLTLPTACKNSSLSFSLSPQSSISPIQGHGKASAAPQAFAQPIEREEFPSIPPSGTESHGLSLSIPHGLDASSYGALTVLLRQLRSRPCPTFPRSAAV
jgi:hypothetical protein